MSFRVARVITRLNVGGPAYQAVLLNHLLAQRNYDTMLIAGRCDRYEPQFDRLLEEYPCQVVFSRHLTRPVNPVRDLLALADVTRALCEFRPDIVHTHTAKAGAIGRIAAKLAGAKCVLHTFHGHVLEGYFGDLTERAIVSLERGLGRITDTVVTLSYRLAADLSGRFKIITPDKCRVVELGVPLERFLHLPRRGFWRTRLGISERAIILGSLGRLVKIKNLSRLIDIFAKLVKCVADKDLHLIIGGTGPLESDITRKVTSYGLTARVHLVGLVEDLPQFYADIDLAILTSDNEGTPVMLLEAQAAGRFVIAPAVGGIPDIVGPESGIVVSPNTPDSYVNALVPILTGQMPLVNPAERYSVVRRFSPDRLVDEIDNLYRELLGQERP